ncbi:recombinase family protein [Anaerocolumna sp. AGMB13020]|uniref:recombinase family protein n=1 Tax=Anaerocolumna sp. AGMB13020 TaxID=3081750 RepID=UPI002953AA92|nr:recombinase family protein [Anaerocolumna sp. AGMB13020]WOO34903.1 recombinase family protein [Anaerocolumna sp. AGMB13020]
MLTAALYIRVSTDKQEELSPDAQKRLLLDYAEKNNMLVSEEYVFIEGGISGKKADKRPKFQRMIGLAKSKDHPFNVILVWKYSRFARNQEESILYKSLLKRNNIDVISISEPLIDGPFGTLIERIIEWMDEYYSIRLSGEVMRGMSEKALRGGYMSVPPLGYASTTPGNPPVVVPEEAELVKTIFNKYVNEELAMFQIARQFNELGVKTRFGKPFQRRTIEYILQNPMYIGYVRWNRQHHSSHTIKSREDWIISKGTHEPIISDDVFNAAQERIKRVAKPLKSRPVTEYKHWLTGIIKCAYCNRALVAASSKNPNIFNFQCSSYAKGKCESNSVSSNILVPAIMEYLQNVINSGVVDYTVKTEDRQIDVSLLEQQLSKLEVKAERIKAAYINGIDTIEEYKMNKELISSERRFIEKQISDLKVDVKHDHKPEMLSRVKELYKILNDDSIDKIAKNKALSSVIERITYNKRESKVKVYFYYR